MRISEQEHVSKLKHSNGVGKSTYNTSSPTSSGEVVVVSIVGGKNGSSG
jgi:hypothetical protein